MSAAGGGTAQRAESSRGLLDRRTKPAGFTVLDVVTGTLICCSSCTLIFRWCKQKKRWDWKGIRKKKCRIKRVRGPRWEGRAARNGWEKIKEMSNSWETERKRPYLHSGHFPQGGVGDNAILLCSRLQVVHRESDRLISLTAFRLIHTWKVYINLHTRIQCVVIWTFEVGLRSTDNEEREADGEKYKDNKKLPNTSFTGVQRGGKKSKTY